MDGRGLRSVEHVEPDIDGETLSRCYLNAVSRNITYRPASEKIGLLDAIARSVDRWVLLL